MSRNLFSYVVRYDYGFAPNPFHDYCTLATCKPLIRKHAQIGDWILGTGSNEKRIRRGEYLVYAMRVTEYVSTKEYWLDPRFERKKPNLLHNWVTASGDNIYAPLGDGCWHQLSSYHTNADGSRVEKHVARDTGIERILVSDDFVYFGGEGPRLPECFLVGGEFQMICIGIGYRRFKNETTVFALENWIRSLGLRGFQGKPWNWVNKRT